MPFEHSCFISYRNHEQSAVAEKFITDLCEALRNELVMRTETDIFVDREGIRGGDIIDPALSRALCTSACLVAVYTPVYFSKQKSYCAREYFAMEFLEKQRLARLSKPLGKEFGLIIPIVLRGALPDEIKKKRRSFNFEHFSLVSKSISKNRHFEPHIREIADAICQRTKMLNATSEDLTCDCDNFIFPTEDEVRPWLDSIVTPPAPFPLRTR
jgi:hypothetical protein